MTELRISGDLALPLDFMTLATVVYGARGSGKTTFGRVLAEEAHRAKQRICAIDLKGDWYGLKSTADGAGPGIPVVVFGGDHADLPLEEGAGAFVAETVAGLEQSCVVDLEHFSKGKQITFLTDFFLRLYEANRSPLLLLADEAQRYAPQKPSSPAQNVCLGAVEDVVKLGRKHGIGVVLFTQRGSSLNKECSELCDTLVAFRTPGVLDQGRIKDWLEANATKDQRDYIMSVISGLPTGTAMFASDHPELKLFQVSAVNRPWTFDSSATPKIGQRVVEPKVLAESDIDMLREKMADAIERAKADDPKELRKTIAGLQRELDRPADVEVRTEVEQVPYEVKVPVEVPMPFLDGAMLQSITGPLEQQFKEFQGGVEDYMEGIFRRMHDSFQIVVYQEAARLEKEVRSMMDDTLRGSQSPRPQVPSKAKVTERESAKTDVTISPRAAGVTTPRGTQPPSSTGRTIDGIKIGKGERKVMAVLAEWPEGRTQQDLHFLTVYSAKASTLGVILSNLRKGGLITPGGEPMIRLTEAGLAAAGGPQVRPTGPELLEFWRNHPRMGKGEKLVLDTLIAAYPAYLGHEELCELTGYSPDASTIGVCLSKLRKLGLVDKTARRVPDQFMAAIK